MPEDTDLAQTKLISLTEINKIHRIPMIVLFNGTCSVGITGYTNAVDLHALNPHQPVYLLTVLSL